MLTSPDAIAEYILQLDQDGILLSCQNVVTHSPDDQDTPFVSPPTPGKRIEDILPESTGVHFQTALELVHRSGQPQFFRYRHTHANATRFFEMRIAPITPGHRNFNIHLLRLSQAPQKPGASSYKRPPSFEILIARLPGAYYRCTYDQNWSVIEISDGIEEIIGYQPEHFLPPAQYTLLDVIYEPDRAYVHRLVHDATQRNSSFTIEYRMIHADGSLRWINEQGQSIFDEHGNPICIEGMLLDVTQSYRHREQATLHTQMTSVGALGAGVAHEINNALAIMMANLDYAVEELETLGATYADDPRLHAPLEDVNQSLSKLDEGMKRIQRIVHDLRSYSDAANNQQLEKTDLIRLIEWSLRELPDLQERARIIRNFPKKPVLTYGNQLGLLQVFTHLFTNAYKSFDAAKTSANQLTISLSHISSHAVLIEIADTGAGIDPNVLPRIFEPFFSTRSIGEGTGLGLFVCQGIIHSMKGEILISSTPNVGTTVQLILPTNIPPRLSSAS